MTEQQLNLTKPILTTNCDVLFSVYEFGWGYCSFELAPQAVCEHLGAADESRKQLLLAFELGKRRILQVTKGKLLPETGERVRLSGADFVAAN